MKIDPVLLPSLPEALQRSIELTGREGVLVITGSIYLVGAALSQLRIAV
jgi:hypothetical protein